MRRTLPDDLCKVNGSAAGLVLGGNPVDMSDVVGDEPDLGAGEERRGGGSVLVRRGLAVEESGESVDCGMQIGMPEPRVG